MKGKKKRGLKLRARDDIRDTATGTVCRIQGTVPAWIWATTGTRPHDIRRRKKGNKRKLTVHHPGTRGKRGWDRVAERIIKVVPEIFADETHRVISRG